MKYLFCKYIYFYIRISLHYYYKKKKLCIVNEIKSNYYKYIYISYILRFKNYKKFKN